MVAVGNNLPIGFEYWEVGLRCIFWEIAIGLYYTDAYTEPCQTSKMEQSFLSKAPS